MTLCAAFDRMNYQINQVQKVRYTMRRVYVEYTKDNEVATFDVMRDNSTTQINGIIYGRTFETRNTTDYDNKEFMNFDTMMKNCGWERTKYKSEVK